MKPILPILLLFVSSMTIQAQRKPTNTPRKDSIANSQEVVDSNLLRGDELIDQFYNSSKPSPSAMWYGNNFSDSRVRLKNTSMDSLPDEINIRLIKSDDEFCFPVKNVITSPYGWRWNRPHRGVDIALNTGDPVRSAFPGVVRIAKPMGAYGNLVVVRHYNGLETVYGHLSKIKVKPKQVVRAGDVLGLGGSTGRSTGPHLHFEVRFQYETFDPEWILDFKTYTLRTKKLHLDKSYFGITQPKSKNDHLAYKADKSYVKEPTKKNLYYVIQDGDSWEDISIKFSTPIDKIKEMNDGIKKPIAGTRIRVR